MKAARSCNPPSTVFRMGSFWFARGRGSTYPRSREISPRAVGQGLTLDLPAVIPISWILLTAWQSGRQPSEPCPASRAIWGELSELRRQSICRSDCQYLARSCCVRRSYSQPRSRLAGCRPRDAPGTIDNKIGLVTLIWR